MRAYSPELRRDVLAAGEAGASTHEIAVEFNVSKSWVRRHLVRELRPGGVVVLDNLNVSKVAGVREAIEAAGASVRYLPPDSPDLNRIEFAFAKFKRLLRDGSERTTEGLWSLCGRALDLFPEYERRSYFRHCGYRHS